MGASREYSLGDFLLMFIAPRWQNRTMGYLWFIVTLFYVFVIITVIGRMRIDLRNRGFAIFVILAGWTVRYCLPGQHEWIKLFNFYSLIWYIPFFVIGIQYQFYEQKVSSIIGPSWVRTDVNKDDVNIYGMAFNSFHMESAIFYFRYILFYVIV